MVEKKAVLRFFLFAMEELDLLSHTSEAQISSVKAIVAA